MPARVSPWLWVVLVAICFAAQGAFAHWHIDGGEMVVAVLGVALAALGGWAHQSTTSELVTLRKSMRPPREPSSPDLRAFPDHDPPTRP